MEKIAKFEKVSFLVFLKAYRELFDNKNEDEIRRIFDEIILPSRASRASAGYDFHAPFAFSLKPNESIMFPTGIRVWMEEAWVLQCFPRSGLGFKYRLQLNNTVGIIDSDYYYSDNEGHIFVKLTNDTNESKTVSIQQNEGFMQGIFTRYGITIDDDCKGIRSGGLGSTTKI